MLWHATSKRRVVDVIELSTPNRLIAYVKRQLNSLPLCTQRLILHTQLPAHKAGVDAVAA